MAKKSFKKNTKKNKRRRPRKTMRMYRGGVGGENSSDVKLEVGPESTNS